MSVQDISPDLDKLEAQLDKVEATIKPLLENISNSTQLPLVDRAKLFTLTNYALESLLFCKRRPLSLGDIFLTISSQP